MHVAIYCRISQDKTGRAEGVEAQDRWGREYAGATWPGVPVLTYCDNDLSAARDDVVRPAFERLRAALAAGDVAHVWAVEQSRLERREVGWFGLRAELTAAGVTEVHTRREGVIQVSGVVAGIKAVLNAHEVRQMKERLMDRLDENASLGRPPGSKSFGYVHGFNERGEKTYLVVPEQAEAIVWAAERVLAGWSLSSVAAALRERGLHGPHMVKVRDAAGQVVTDEQGRPVTRPSTLTPGSVRSMLTMPTVAGHRIHRGVDVGKGNWPAILDEATWQAVRAKLSAPREVTRQPNPDGSGPTTYPIGAAHTGYSGRKYLLTGGLARCGVCGAALSGSVKQLKGGKSTKPYLLCHPTHGGRACVGIMLTETEQHVVDTLFAELDKPEFLDQIAVDGHAARRADILNELDGIEGKRRELAAEWAKPGGLTLDEWKAARTELERAERELRAELAAKPAPPARVSIEQARESWPHMELGERREFIRLFVAEVTVNRAVPGRKGFDPGRVDIRWRLLD